MKRLYLVAVLLLAILIATPTASADNCRQAVIVQKHYDYVAPATYYPVPVVGFLTPIPSYTVGLSAHDDRIERLLQKIESPEMKLNAPQAMPLSLSHTSTKCVSCHSGGKGPGPVIDFTKLSPELKALSIERVLDGSMPPKSRLSKEERRAVVAEVVK